MRIEDKWGYKALEFADTKILRSFLWLCGIIKTISRISFALIIFTTTWVSLQPQLLQRGLWTFPPWGIPIVDTLVEYTPMALGLFVILPLFLSASFRDKELTAEGNWRLGSIALSAIFWSYVLLISADKTTIPYDGGASIFSFTIAGVDTTLTLLRNYLIFGASCLAIKWVIKNNASTRTSLA